MFFYIVQTISITVKINTSPYNPLHGSYKTFRKTSYLPMISIERN